MSQADVEILRGAFDALAEGDVGAWFAGADPDIRIYPRPAEPDAADEYQGLDGLMEYVVNWFSQWDEYVSEAIEFVDAGEQILVVVRERGRIKQTGIEVEGDFSHSFRLRDGKVTEWRMYDSHSEAREALGLPASG